MQAKFMLCLIVCLVCGVGLSYGKDKHKKKVDSETANRIITEAYQDLLGRKPDAEGLKEFRIRMVDEGWDEGKVRDALKKSEEYQKGHTDRIIKAAYKDLLGRAPDDEGRKIFREKIAKEGWDEEQVRKAIRESAEYKSKKAGTKK